MCTKCIATNTYINDCAAFALPEKNTFILTSTLQAYI